MLYKSFASTENNMRNKLGMVLALVMCLSTFVFAQNSNMSNGNMSGGNMSGGNMSGGNMSGSRRGRYGRG
jgi:uncharacterized membrane protein YgcG